MINFRAVLTRVDEHKPVPQHNYEPKSGDGPILTMREFLPHMSEITTTFEGEEFNRLLADRINIELDRFFQQVALHRHRIQIFDNVFLTGVSLKFQPDKYERGVMVRAAGLVIDQIKTESSMQRLPAPGGESAYLGCIDGIDTFIGYQGSLPPTIVFAGLSPHFATFNPVMNRMPHPNDPEYHLYSHAVGRYDMATKFYEARLPLRD